jgi:transglutaminase-like putative cysteine protease
VSAETGSARFAIVHTTQYDYSEAVSVSHHVARVTPRTLAHQTCEQHQMEIDPPPAVVKTHVDYFGNEMTFFAMQSPHTGLTVRTRSTVTVDEVPASRRGSSVPWERAADPRLLPLEAVECALEVRPQRTLAKVAAYARSSFPPGCPLIEAVAALTARIHADFVFDSKATTVETSLAQVFELRRGVCQDFARMEIACLRALGIPARYVSGYLETVPPKGRLRLVGADASHAWVAVYCPDIGWVDVDPTNNVFPSGTHVTLAWGRDYADVSPTRGVILGGGHHELKVSVDVVRLPEA